MYGFRPFETQLISDEDRLRLETIRERLDLIRAWTRELDHDTFVSNQLVRDAVAFSLLVIGETSRRLGEDIRARAPELPWAAIIALRNRIAHGYASVDHAIVWQIVQSDLPPFAEAIERLLSAETG